MKKHSVVITGKIADEAIKILEPSCNIHYTKPYMGEEEFALLMAGAKADALIVRGVSGKVTRKVMEASGKVKVIAKHGVGVDNIDVEAASALGIPVLNTPDANYQAVAEHVLGLIFALAKDIPQQDARMRAGFWDKQDYRGVEINKKTLGLIGFGKIGQRVRELVTPLQMKIVVFDPEFPLSKRNQDVSWVDDVDTLLAVSDIVSLHCPLTEKTRGMIGEEQFNKMKKTAFLINTARGPIIKEADLVSALKEKKIAGVGLDTFAKQPPEQLAELANAGKTVFTPHLGAATHEAFLRMGLGAANGVLSILEGNPPDPACHFNR